MWTVRRIVMLMISFAVHVAGYATYASFLGNIDALPPLPIDMLAKERGPGPGPEPPLAEVDRRLNESFGGGCKELQRPLRLWLPDRGAAFAAGEFNIEPDGRVRLAPFSAAIYHKRKLPGDFPEISTLRCDVAILTLDKGIANFGELNGRKVIAVELRGSQITITNNRGTAEKGDDLDIFITNAPLFYEERRDLIWTDGVVCLTDYQTKPATKVRGKGMEMLLAKEANPNRPKDAKAKGHSDSNNVEKIILHSDVEMDFWTDGSAGFLGGPPNKKNPPPAQAVQGQAGKPDLPAAEVKPAPKAHIRIHTGGMFVYDLTKEFAWFERPLVREGNASRPAADPLAPNQVHVERRQTIDGRATFDQLICDRLELQFRKKTTPRPDAAAPAATGGDKEIEIAKAFKRGENSEVVLSLDSEGLAAYGNEMHYYAGEGNKGPKTILKGDPLRSVKDGHQMVCTELHIQGANRTGEGQESKAWGPGKIDLLDEKNPDKDDRPTHILWLDTLTVVKAKEGNDVFDLMTVEGEACFKDDLQKQELHAEKITVWMLAPNDSVRKPQATVSGKQEVRKVLAERRVRAFGPEFIVRQANELTMTFLPEVTRPDRAPKLPAPDAVKPGGGLKQADGGGPKPKDPPPAVAAKGGPVEPKKADPPIELTGKKISIHVSTVGGKKQVEDLVAKGNVYVFQPGDEPAKKRIDIHGQLLTVKNNDDKGHTMVVHGDAKAKARVELSDLVLWGPIVTIDQAVNRAEVDGDGAMQMPTNKNLDGTDIAKDKDKNKPSPRITVYWKNRMTFNGKNADFYGGVQAFQQGSYSRMTCEHLVTYLDRYVSFKEGQKNGEKDAKIERIICDQNVFIDDSKVDEKTKQLVQGNIIQGWQLVNHQDGRTDVTGPGQCRQLAIGGGEPTLGPQPPGGKTQPKAKTDAKKDAAKQQWMLTHVKFPARMFYSIDEQTKTKKATFWANPGSFVDVYHFPCTDINGTMNPDHPPKDGLYLRCENLVVRGEETKDRTTQIMIARQNVYFKTDIYLGYADVVKYDENTEMVTMECFKGNLVRLYKFDENGQKKATVNSDKVLYNRKTGEITTTGVKSIEN